ncbi:unnamed protein product [Didymodactylos carnosus]|uniref:PDZ domain-containing protein n=1 Tax=Didymodactylos carnosus TaxID=1234261 RepID=A0A813QIW9_9BILA|nr:unnamed protein product [Didymodactylos carnosus]CAF0874819.1 unnamed protein product [Didymodactylos carnosus]CAF3548925.1 unnamed protein product [Didymodactylos carnosus]CAF3659329.1 unnamed protein product [Didymodactylos carnosus]
MQYNNNNNVQTVHLVRDSTEKSWGFRLQGGADFSIPLSVQLVNPNTPAQQSGLAPGDQVLTINGRNVTSVSHQEAKMEITRSGNDLELIIVKGAVDISSSNQPLKPQSVSQLRTGPVQQIPTTANDTARQSYAVEKPEPTRIGSSHNRAPMPFDKRVGNELVYQSAKSANWEPANFETSTAYNKDPLVKEPWRPKSYRDDPNAPPRNVGTAIFHSQYNSPIGLYSDDKVLEAFKSQAGSLIDDIKGGSGGTNNPYPPQQNPNAFVPSSPTYQAVMNQNSSSKPLSSESKLSRSFRMLEQDLGDAKDTGRAPMSIFEQRRQQQQQQQQKPVTGFRSVKPPEEVPVDQQRRPYHTEYQVEHVQEKWIEPKYQ